jgi:hypothetical protein
LIPNTSKEKKKKRKKEEKKKKKKKLSLLHRTWVLNYVIHTKFLGQSLHPINVCNCFQSTD